MPSTYLESILTIIALMLAAILVCILVILAIAAALLGVGVWYGDSILSSVDNIAVLTGNARSVSDGWRSITDNNGIDVAAAVARMAPLQNQEMFQEFLSSGVVAYTSISNAAHTLDWSGFWEGLAPTMKKVGQGVTRPEAEDFVNGVYHFGRGFLGNTTESRYVMGTVARQAWLDGGVMLHEMSDTGLELMEQIGVKGMAIMNRTEEAAVNLINSVAGGNFEFVLSLGDRNRDQNRITPSMRFKEP